MVADQAERADRDLAEVDLAGSDVGERTPVGLHLVLAPMTADVGAERAPREAVNGGCVLVEILASPFLVGEGQDDRVPLCSSASLRSSTASRRKQEGGYRKGQVSAR